MGSKMFENETLFQDMFIIETTSQDPELDSTREAIIIGSCLIVLVLGILVQVRLHYFLKGKDDRCINRIIRSNQVRQLTVTFIRTYAEEEIAKQFPTERK
jgi:hypothetical protein